MKNKHSLRFQALLLAGIFSATGAFARHSGNANKTQLLSATANESVIKFTMSDYDLAKVTTPWGEASVVHAPNTTPILRKGAPNLPKFAVSVMIPDQAKMDVQIVSSKYTDYQNVEIAPSKGNIMRNVNPSTVPFEKGTEYSSKTFFPSNLAELREPYILRDYRGQTALVYPFQYNPFTKTLRVYSEITVKVFQSGDGGGNAIARASYPEKIDKEFSYIYEDHFLNVGSYSSVSKGVNPLYTPIAEFGKMLIICYGSYMSAMQPFVDWKRRTGIQVTMVDVATAGGTATAIKAYVQNFYTTQPGMAFLLLVGDAAQLPPMVLASGDSDNGYAYLTGTDGFPDILVGRFSAESAAHVTTQVDRVLRYEKFPQAGATWYNHGIGIGSDQGPGDDNEYDWQHERNIRTQLMGFTYATVDELYDGSQGGMDAAGYPSSTLVTTAVNNGATVINYTGHGSQTSWVTTGFSVTSVNALNNVDKYPFVWSVGCVNGDFNGITCFGEAWARASKTGGPTGAIGSMMSTVNQSWDPPMEAQDEFNAILAQTHANNIKRTFGGISMNGCLQMNEKYGAQGTEMTDTWVLFGDPSVMVRTDNPVPMTVTHVPAEIIGVTQLVVNCNLNGALVGLTVGGNVIGSGFINGTSVTITFPAITSACTIDVTVTGFNKIPYMGTVLVGATGVAEVAGGISNAGLYPNPAAAFSTLSYTLGSEENVSAYLSDALGRQVMSIVTGKLTAPGTYTTKVDVSSLQRGIYFCTVKAGEATLTKKLVVTR